MAEARRCSTLFQASHRVLGPVLRKPLDWSWNSACLKSPLARFDIPSFVLTVINERAGASRKITDARYIIDERQRPTCYHAANTGSTCRFKKKSLFCLGNIRTAFRIGSRGGTCAVSQFMLNMSMDPYRLCLAAC